MSWKCKVFGHVEVRSETTCYWSDRRQIYRCYTTQMCSRCLDWPITEAWCGSPPSGAVVEARE